MDARHLKNPVDIPPAALEKETAACGFYADLASRRHIDFIQDLLFLRQNEAEKRMDLIRKLFTRLADGPSFA